MSNSRHLDDVLTRYNQLQALKVRVETEARELAEQIDRLLGHSPSRRLLKKGRPRKPVTMTPLQMKEAHRRYHRGDRTPEVVEGERQYNRAAYQRRLAREKAAS